MVLGADQGSDGAGTGPMAAWPRIGAGIAAGVVRAAGPRARRRAMAAAVSCAALLAGLAAAAPAAASAVRGHGAASGGRAAVPGSQLWVSRYNGPAGSGNFARSVAVSPGGGTVFVTGTSFGGTSGGDYATVAYDAATGARRWVSRYNGPASSDDGAGSVAVSPDGTMVFVTGGSTGPAPALTMRRWPTTRRPAPSGGSAATTGPPTAVTAPFRRPSARAGRPSSSPGPAPGHRDDYATVAYNAATGAQRWASRYNGPANRDDRASSLAVSPGGATVFVTGTSRGSGLDYATVAYNAATGARRWASRYNAGGDDSARSVAVSPGGATVFVTGVSRGAAPRGLDYATVAYNAATGARRWVSRYNGRRNKDDFAVSVAAGPGGHSVFVTGTSFGGTSGLDYATVAYNAATGAPRWVSRYNGPAGGADFAGSLSVSPGGSAVFVTGTSSGGTSGGTELEDYATVAYNAATGARLWTSRYHGPAGQSDASALAVSPDGTKVFVTGTTVAGTSRRDYATVAYKR